MAKSKYGKYSPDQWRDHLQDLEAVFGSQKAAAKKLGVDVSTYRAWKTGKRTPPKSSVQKANRLYGRHRAEFEREEIKQRAEKKRKKTETLRQAREPQRKREKIKTLDLWEWLDRYLSDEQGYLRTELDGLLREKGRVYAVYDKDNPTEAQFVSMDEYLMEKFGKPKGQRSFKLIGIVWVYPYEDEGLEVSPPIVRDLLGYGGRVWSVSETLDFGRQVFSEEIERRERGKRHPNEPKRFVGYYL